MNIQPLRDKLAIKPLHEPQFTKSGIALYASEKGRGRTCRGEVIAVGPGKTLPNGARVPMEINVGDIVYFGSGAQPVRGTPYWMASQADIMGIEES